MSEKSKDRQVNGCFLTDTGLGQWKAKGRKNLYFEKMSHHNNDPSLL